MSRRELYGNVLTIAIAVLVVAWVSFAWTSMTGLTFVGSRGYDTARNATARDHRRTGGVAVVATLIAGPIALWAAQQRKKQ